MDTLQSLRCIAFFGVFLGHTQLTSFSSCGNWAVSIFLVLSGFVMTYNYGPWLSGVASDELKTIWTAYIQRALGMCQLRMFCILLLAQGLYQICVELAWRIQA